VDHEGGDGGGDGPHRQAEGIDGDPVLLQEALDEEEVPKKVTPLVIDKDKDSPTLHHPSKFESSHQKDTHHAPKATLGKKKDEKRDLYFFFLFLHLQNE